MPWEHLPRGTKCTWTKSRKHPSEVVVEDYRSTDKKYHVRFVYNPLNTKWVPSSEIVPLEVCDLTCPPPVIEIVEDAEGGSAGDEDITVCSTRAAGTTTRASPSQSRPRLSPSRRITTRSSNKEGARLVSDTSTAKAKLFPALQEGPPSDVAKMPSEDEASDSDSSDEEDRYEFRGKIYKTYQEKVNAKRRFNDEMLVSLGFDIVQAPQKKKRNAQTGEVDHEELKQQSNKPSVVPVSNRVLRSKTCVVPISNRASRSSRRLNHRDPECAPLDYYRSSRTQDRNFPINNEGNESSSDDNVSMVELFSDDESEALPTNSSENNTQDDSSDKKPAAKASIANRTSPRKNVIQNATGHGGHHAANKISERTASGCTNRHKAQDTDQNRADDDSSGHQSTSTVGRMVQDEDILFKPVLDPPQKQRLKPTPPPSMSNRRRPARSAVGAASLQSKGSSIENDDNTPSRQYQDIRSYIDRLGIFGGHDRSCTEIRDSRESEAMSEQSDAETRPKFVASEEDEPWPYGSVHYIVPEKYKDPKSDFETKLRQVQSIGITTADSHTPKPIPRKILEEALVSVGAPFEQNEVHEVCRELLEMTDFEIREGLVIHKMFEVDERKISFRGVVKGGPFLCRQEDNPDIFVKTWLVKYDDGDTEHLERHQVFHLQWRQMNFLELFCGQGTVTSAFEEQGFSCQSVDNNHAEMASTVCDVMAFTPQHLDAVPDAVWASLPCETYSRLGGGRHRSVKRGDFAVSDKARAHNELLIKLLNILRWAQQKMPCLRIVLENPVGQLTQDLPIMNELIRQFQLDEVVVDYCQFKQRFKKPTRLWSNDKRLIEDLKKYRCTKDSCPYHQSHREQVRGNTTRLSVAVIPETLATLIADHIRDGLVIDECYRKPSPSIAASETFESFPTD